jgi:hypothetical protein
MSDVLPLVGDGDEVDLVRDIEQTFAVVLDPQELQNCVTVGDLHQLLLVSVPHSERGQTSCLAAKAFFKLKRAIEKQQSDGVIRPSTELASVTGRLGVYRWSRQCERKTGLSMPALVLVGGPWFWRMFFLGWCGSIGWLLNYSWIGALIALPVPVVVLAVAVWVSRFPKRLGTVGELARAVAALNVATLANPNEPLRKREIWAALQEIIRNHLIWSGAVHPTTRFFPENS